eukprot:TRINITY_DN2179_c0_g1_i2.p1 TRINITY_DN2179_c0_g1~~TRINITY_DN2179_c0_g1_i2.p1  ORF type:complete len:103 (-),score=22.36 TRINITY_DN2179_c0_g1_i2:267-575(-)
MIRRPPRSTLSSSSAASDVYKRQVTAIVAGLAAGTLGITGFAGLFFYAFWMAVLAAVQAFQTGFKVNEYFLSSSGLVIEGLSQGGMTFMLFWMIMYGVVHVF